MAKILVSGLINLEITLRVDGFPILYQPVRYPFFGIDSTVSGVGYNIAKAMTKLGDDINFISIIGRDQAANLVRQRLVADCLRGDFVISGIEATAHSVILYAAHGERQINVDLKNIQETKYPRELFEKAVKDVSLAVLCNINFSRPFLALAKSRGILIATDVHVISNLEHDYDRDFMTHADILFMSDEGLPCGPEDWARKVINRYGNEIVVIGLGAGGALLSVKSDSFVERVPAVHTREIIDTVGAGDALFSAFVHYYCKSRDPYEAIKKAVLFASYKLGEKGAADGFLTEEELEMLYKQLEHNGPVAFVSRTAP